MNRRTDDARQTANCGARKIVLGSLGSIAVLAALLAQLFGPASPVGSWVDTGPGSPGPSGGRSESAREPIPSRSVEGPILFDSDWIAGAELARAHRAVFVEKGVVLADRAGVLFVDLVAERVGRALGRGEGPGEILSLLPRVSRVDEGIVVWDSRLRRASNFTQSGALRGSAVLRNTDGPGFIGALDDRNFVFVKSPVLDSMPDGRGRHPTELHVVSSDATSRLLAAVPSNEYVHVRDPPMYPLRLVRVIFGHGTYLAVSQGRVFVADTAEDSVIVYNGQGDVVSRIPMPSARPAASDRQVAHIRDSLTAEWQALPELPPPFVKPPTPEYEARDGPLPPIDALTVDADGRLWMRAHLLPGDAKQYWTVWDGDEAAFVAEISVHEDFMDAEGDRVLLRTEDDFGVRRVVVRALRAP